MSHDLDPTPRDEWADPFWLCQHPGPDSAVRTRIFNFSFPTWADAEKFSDRVRQAGYPAEVSEYAGEIELPWPVTVIASLKPQDDEALFEESIKRIAALIGGRQQPP